METIRRMTKDNTTQDMVATVENAMEETPVNIYLWATLASIVVSAYLFATGRRWASLFVGLWAPTIINFGLFSKLLRPSRDLTRR
jgi:hypothetical protein